MADAAVVDELVTVVAVAVVVVKDFDAEAEVILDSVTSVSKSKVASSI